MIHQLSSSWLPSRGKIPSITPIVYSNMPFPSLPMPFQMLQMPLLNSKRSFHENLIPDVVSISHP